MILLLYLNILLATAPLTNSKEAKTYSVKKITEELSITGNGDNALWKKAHPLSDFRYPWESDIPPATVFKALHNDDWLYCFFDVTDDNVNILVDKNHKSEVASSSRAEIFFRKDDRLSPYYCLEMDPLGRVFDYEAEYHRKFNTTWSWPAGDLIIKTDRRKGGYTIEVAISKASLEELGLLKNQTLQAGLYRGDCLNLTGGDERFRWISWVIPDSKTPDFHIPSSFGKLLLE